MPRTVAVFRLESLGTRWSHSLRLEHREDAGWGRGGDERHGVEVLVGRQGGNVS